jgi:hypothetical protein
MFERMKLLSITISLFSLFLFSLHNATAGTYYVSDWNKTFNLGPNRDEPSSVAVDSQNNIIIAGFNRTTATTRTYWNITKLDKDGNLIWNYTYSSGPYDEQPASVAVDTDDNFVVVGYYNASPNARNDYGWMIMKFNKFNVQVWNRSYNISFGNDRPLGVAIDHDKNITVVGYYNASGKTNTDYGWYILKLDKDGNYLGNRSFNFTDYTEYAYDVAIDNDNNITVVGFDNIPDNYEWRIMKFDKNLNLIWEYTDDISPTYPDEARSVAIDHDDNIIVAGYDSLTTDNYEWRIRKFDKNKNLVWDYTNDTSPSYDMARSLVIDKNDNNITVVGYYNASSITNIDYGWMVIRLGWDKATLWSYKENFSNYDDEAKSVDVDNNDNIIVIGYDDLLRTASANYQWRIMKFVTCDYNSTYCSQYGYNWTGSKCCEPGDNYLESTPNNNNLCVNGLNKTCYSSSECDVWNIGSVYYCDDDGGSTYTWQPGTGTTHVCDYSAWNGCPSSCLKKRDILNCNGNSGEAGACDLDSGDDTQPCGSGNNCTDNGVCSSGLCDSTFRCSIGPGDDNYPSSGNYKCQGTCDSSGNCDYATNCVACGSNEYCENGVCKPHILIIDSIEIKPGETVNPTAGGNVKMNVTVNITNSTPIESCTIRIFNATGSYSNPTLGPWAGTIQFVDNRWQCFKEWNMEYWRNPGDWNVSVDLNYYISEWLVGAGADDASEQGNGYFSATTEDIDVYSNTNPKLDNYRCGGFRFPNVGIPRGSSVSSANFSAYIYPQGMDDINCKIYGNDVDDAEDFSTNPNIINQTERHRTSNSSSWVQDNLGSSWTEKSGLKNIIQEIIDRPGWNSDNAIVLLLIANTDKENFTLFYSRDWGYAAKLKVTWTLATSNFTSKNFTYNSLYAWTDNITTGFINWTGLPGQTVNSSNAFPMLVNNTGNTKLNISINGSDFINGPYVIGVGNASFSNYTINTFYNLSKTPQFMINLSVLEVKYIYFRAYIPIGFISQQYNNSILMNQFY